jgi:inositol transport system substrate-binding protein
MKRLVTTFAIAFAASAIMMTSAMAQKIGVSLAYFDDRFLVDVREAMETTAKQLGVSIQFEDAQGDIGKQLSQIQNFAAQKMNAIIVNPVDSSATPKMTKLATAAGIPLVYVNRKPAEETLPEKVVYVGSDENVSGKLEGEWPRYTPRPSQPQVRNW